MTEKVLPFPGQMMLKNVEFDSYAPIPKTDITTDPEEAVVVTSVVGTPEGSYTEGNVGDRHKLIIDVDFPVYAVPSSTPGHSHLYIDKEITFDGLIGILYAMADAGIVEPNYASACDEQGMSCVRTPWTKKENA